MALSHLGMQKVFTTTPNNDPRIVACNLYYDDALKDTYEANEWSFATVKDQFAQVDADVVGWSYVYAYPPKAASINYVYSEANVKYKIEQEFEVVYLPDTNKKVVCSDEESAYIEYTHIVEDTTLFSSKFVTALSFKLAALMAQTLTNDPGVSQAMQQNAGLIVQEAQRLNKGEKIKKPEQTNSIVNSRV
jgi:hypothetical protein